MINSRSIGSGSIAEGTSIVPSSSNDEACTPRRQLSWSDFDSLERQMARHTETMQERIKILEQHIEDLEHQLPSTRSGEQIGLLGWDDGGAIGDVVHEEENKHRGTVASPEGGDNAQTPQCESKFPTIEMGRRLRRRTYSRRSAKAILPSESEVERIDDRFELPESTYTMLTTEKILSIGFATGIFAAILPMMCLIIVFMNEIDNAKPGNPLALPWNVGLEVRMAQYLALLIGVLMENEIPQGLEIIGKGAEQSLSRCTRFSMKRIVLPALLRLCVGYMFLVNLFVSVAQSSSVINMFYDILALEFVENIDDVIFGLSKRGFFGRKLKAATRPHFIESSRESNRLRRWTKRTIRFFYIFNMGLSLGALSYFAMRQNQGTYRCKVVAVSFGDEVWEDAYVEDVMEKRLVIYSHFNGIYEEQPNELYHNRPRYIERNKVDGAPFKHGVTPAEIVYCQEIESWVFRHKDIRTSNNENGNDCKWMLRSPRTDSFHLIQLAEEAEWYLWTGHVKPEIRISIECVNCEEGLRESCNYHGECGDKRCDCDDGYFGSHCQFSRPCDELWSEKDENTRLQLLGNSSDFIAVYGRPMYLIRNMTGKPTSFLRLGYADTDMRDDHFNDDFFQYNNRSVEFQELLKNFTVVMYYTGLRWYVDMLPSGLPFDENYHAFWDHAFTRRSQPDNSTFLISAPAYGLTPEGVDFYEMRRRNVPFNPFAKHFDYGPFGVLIPLAEYEGSGFFHCTNPDGQ